VGQAQHGRPDRLERRAVGVGFLDPAGEVVQLPAPVSEQDRFLGVEVAEEGPLGDADLGDDLVDGGLLVALGLEQLPGGRLDRAPGGDLPLASSPVGVLGSRDELHGISVANKNRQFCHVGRRPSTSLICLVFWMQKRSLEPRC
jgi:hypothetical protein